MKKFTKHFAFLTCIALLLALIALPVMADWQYGAWTIPSGTEGTSPSNIYAPRKGFYYTNDAEVSIFSFSYGSNWGASYPNGAIKTHIYNKELAKQVTSRLSIATNGTRLPYLSSSYISSSSYTFKPVTYKARSSDLNSNVNIEVEWLP